MRLREVFVFIEVFEGIDIRLKRYGRIGSHKRKQVNQWTPFKVQLQHELLAVPATGTSIMYLSSFLKVKICKNTRLKLLPWQESFQARSNNLLLLLVI